jgi:hypothetical protein
MGEYAKIDYNVSFHTRSTLWFEFEKGAGPIASQVNEKLEELGERISNAIEEEIGARPPMPEFLEVHYEDLGEKIFVTAVLIIIGASTLSFDFAVRKAS